MLPESKSAGGCQPPSTTPTGPTAAPDDRFARPGPWRLHCIASRSLDGVQAVRLSPSQRRLAFRPQLELLEDRSTPAAGWATSTLTPTNGSDPGVSIALDTAGNSYISGYFAGTTYFGSTSLTSDAASIDAYIAKLDPAGNFLWARRIGGAGTDYAWDVTVDPASGEIYATGQFTGTVPFGSTTLTSVADADVYIARLDTSGNFQWVKRAGGNVSGTQPSEGGREVVLDGAGNLYVGGIFRGTADFGSTILTSAGGTDGFVSKMTTQGDFIWARQTGGATDDVVMGMAVDAGQNVYITGDQANGTSYYVTRLNGNGDFVWTRGAGGRSVAVDASGNIYASGGRALSKLNVNGDVLWTRQVSGGDIYPFDMTVDAAGNS